MLSCQNKRPCASGDAFWHGSSHERVSGCKVGDPNDGLQLCGAGCASPLERGCLVASSLCWCYCEQCGRISSCSSRIVIESADSPYPIRRSGIAFLQPQDPHLKLVLGVRLTGCSSTVRAFHRAHTAPPRRPHQPAVPLSWRGFLRSSRREIDIPIPKSQMVAGSGTEVGARYS